MQSNFRKVIEFNKQFGIKIFDTPQYNIFNEDSKLVEYRMNLIREEVKELDAGIISKNVIEVIDALADILYVVYGMGVSIGFNIDNAFVFAAGNDNFDKINNYYKSKKMLAKKFDFDSEMFKKKVLEFKINMAYLEMSVFEKDYKGVSDYLIGLVFGAYSIGYFMEIDMNEAFDIVHKSNMSKLCVDITSAADTIKWYLDKGPRNEKGELLYTSPEFRRSYDEKYYVVYDAQKSKILKSIYYTEADFTKMLSKESNNKSDN